MIVGLCRLLRQRGVCGSFAAAALLAFALVSSRPSDAADGWAVVFEDQFTLAQLNTAAWYTRFVYNNGTLDHLGNEKQRYGNAGNHSLKNGVLSLIAKKPWSSGFYSSGMIRSRQTFRYGYFEARLKLPPGRGVFPAFWLNSDYDSTGRLDWPPEIDIMEFAPNGVNEFPNMVHSNVALSTPNKQGGEWFFHNSNFNQQYKFYRAPVDLTKDWHVYGMLWGTDNTVTVYLDGMKLWQRRYRWVYKDGREAGPAHILINLAVGGDWAGLGGIDNSKFPAAFQVDYVRVCKRASSTNAQPTCGGSKYTPK
jgi:beta-glucanase (GH16 family)